MRGFPERYLVLDTETEARQPGEDPTLTELTLKMGVVKIVDQTEIQTDFGGFYHFHTCQELHEIIGLLELSGKPILIFAHNMGFDARIAGFFRELAIGRYSLTPPVGTPRAGCYKEPLVVIDNSPFIVRLFRQDGQILILCDTVQWFGCSLKELGESIGIPKLDMPLPDALEKAWAIYCQQDVEILDQALRKLWSWLRSIGCHDWQYTRASQAMYLWKVRNGHAKIEQPESTALLSLDRHAYYGGRSDCFQVGRIEGTCWKLDVNSMYPFIMRNNVFPCRVVDYDHNPGTKTDLSLEFPLACTAEVWLDTDSTPYPVRCSDGTHWVAGKVRTVLCGPELEQAKARGHIHCIGRWTRYEMRNMFRRFVDEFYSYRLEARKAGDKVQDLLCKLILNSLYGKFGQRTGEWVVIGQEYPEQHYGSGKIVGATVNQDLEFRILAGCLQVRIREQEDERSFVPTAAYVASYGRVHMDAVRAQLDPMGVYYQCVDSLIVSDANYLWFLQHNQLDPDRLGAWKEEGPWDDVVIRSIGNLDLGSHQIRAGLKQGAIPLGREWYEVEEWETATAGIYQGNVSSVSIRRIVKHLSEQYKRGHVSPNGSIRPYSVSNWDKSPEQQSREPLSRV